MANVLIIIAHENFQDHEFRIPKEILKDNKITIASTETTPAKGVLGTEVTPDITIEKALEQIDEFDAVIFVGGAGAKNYFENKIVLEIAQKAKIIAAICIAPIILANAGVLKGKKATVWDDGNKTQANLIESKGAEYIPEQVVVDQNVITANGPRAAEEFGRKIKDLLS